MNTKQSPRKRRAPERQKSLARPPEFVTKTQLRGRGWTPALIDHFLGEPDEQRIIRRYRSAAPVCLYELARVKKAEASQEFRNKKKISSRRSRIAKKAKQKQRDKL